MNHRLIVGVSTVSHIYCISWFLSMPTSPRCACACALKLTRD